MFVGSQDGTVYSLDAKTGCTIWTFKAQARVRTAIVIGTAHRRRGRYGRTSATGARTSTRSTRRPASRSGAQRRHASERARHRVADASTRIASTCRVASGEEGQGGNATLRVLHVPRQRRRAQPRQRRRRLEDATRLPRSRGTIGTQHERHGALGPLRRGHLGVADRRSEAPRALRRDRQHVYGAAAEDERRGDGVRASTPGKSRGLAQVTREGRLRRRLQPAERARTVLPASELGPDFDFGNVADARRRCRADAI